MKVKYFASSLLLLLIFFVEIVHYKRITSGYYDKLPRCYPTGDIFHIKTPWEELNMTLFYHTIADFKLTNQNGEVITTAPWIANLCIKFLLQPAVLFAPDD